jgi:uncharacterized surface protein with fasciclin (FAS1) repeats
MTISKGLMFKAATLAVALGMGSTALAGGHEKSEAKAHHGDAAAHATMDIVHTAVSNEQFSTLVAAIQAADLAEVLSGEGPFTVFAPTNAAFAKLPDGTVETLLLPENKERLAAILTYHVVPGAIHAKDVTGTSKVKTVEGSEVEVKRAGDVVTIDNATVTTADIEASNGVIHVIDTVILPAE